MGGVTNFMGRQSTAGRILLWLDWVNKNQIAADNWLKTKFELYNIRLTEEGDHESLRDSS
jgi:hypothetical protein